MNHYRGQKIEIWTNSSITTETVVVNCFEGILWYEQKLRNRWTWFNAVLLCSSPWPSANPPGRWDNGKLGSKLEMSICRHTGGAIETLSEGLSCTRSSEMHTDDCVYACVRDCVRYVFLCGWECLSVFPLCFALVCSWLLTHKQRDRKSKRNK